MVACGRHYTIFRAQCAFHSQLTYDLSLTKQLLIFYKIVKSDINSLKNKIMISCHVEIMVKFNLP